MKKTRMIVLLVIALALISTSLLAETKESPTSMEAPQFIKGAGSYGRENLEAIEAIGHVKLNGTSVSKVQLTGSLISNSAVIGSLQVSGDANLSDTVVREEAIFAGYLHTQKSVFEHAIILTMQRAVLIHSKLQGVKIRSNMGFKGKQVLELRQGTIIDGPVSFESGKGEIHLYSGSKVTGTVTGGKVVICK